MAALADQRFSPANDRGKLGLQHQSVDAQVRQRILEPLARLRQLCRLYLFLDGLRRLVMVGLLVGVSQLALDRWLRLALDQRAVVSVLVTATCLWVAFRRVLRPLLRRLPDEVLASLVDRAHPELCDRLSTAVQLAPLVREFSVTPVRPAAMPEYHSPALVRDVLSQACRDAQSLSFFGVLDHRRAVSRLAQMLGLGVLAVAGSLWWPDLAGTWLARNWLLEDISWPQRTHIWPDGFDASGSRRLARGDVVDISASVTGQVPAAASLEWWSTSGRRGRESMSVVGETQLMASIGQLSEELRFRIIGGDERTREFVVEAVERPRVIHTLARIAPPAYTRLDPVVIEQQTVLEILDGATLEIVARVNKPVTSVRFVGADGADAPADVVAVGADSAAGAETRAAAGEPSVHVLWSAPISGAYRFELIDADGLVSQNAVRYTLKVVPDRPPTVRMELVGTGELVTLQAQVPVAVQAEDTYGLGALRLLIQVGSQPPRVLPMEGFVPGMRSAAPRLALGVGEAGVAVGDQLRIGAEAADLDPRGPNVAATPMLSLRVVTPDDLQLELARRELTLRQEFERQRSTQRSLQDTLARLPAESPDAQTPAEVWAQRLAALARGQAQQVGRCQALGRSFEQILAELQVNRVARPADERRITERVVAPLGRLAQEAIPSAGDALSRLRAAPTAENRAASLAAQETVLRQMDEILSNMLEWEGYREAVALLQEVVTAQAQLRTQTLDAVQGQLDDILGHDEPSGPPRPPAP